MRKSSIKLNNQTKRTMQIADRMLDSSDTDNRYAKHKKGL